MAYYLGRDVKVYLTAEVANNVRVNTSGQINDSSGTDFAKGRDQGLSGALVTDLTGVDLGIGAVDEDISFIGLRTGSVTAGNATNSYTGLEKPTVNYGYRVHIQLMTSGEVFTIRNATITGHSTSISADGVQEETCEFQSHVDPKIGTTASVDTGETGSTEI